MAGNIIIPAASELHYGGDLCAGAEEGVGFTGIQWASAEHVCLQDH
jgi:hypothetical protein